MCLWREKSSNIYASNYIRRKIHNNSYVWLILSALSLVLDFPESILFLSFVLLYCILQNILLCSTGSFDITLMSGDLPEVLLLLTELLNSVHDL